MLSVVDSMIAVYDYYNISESFIDRKLREGRRASQRRVDVPCAGLRSSAGSCKATLLNSRKMLSVG